MKCDVSSTTSQSSVFVFLGELLFYLCFSVTHLLDHIWAWARSSTVSPSAPSVPASWCRLHRATGAPPPQSTACCCHPACAPGPLMWESWNAEYKTSASRENECMLFGCVCLIPDSDAVSLNTFFTVAEKLVFLPSPRETLAEKIMGCPSAANLASRW